MSVVSMCATGCRRNGSQRTPQGQAGSAGSRPAGTPRSGVCQWRGAASAARRFGPAHAGGDAPEPEAVRLGRHVVSRRVALGYRTRIDLADSVQFTVRTLADIEHGVRKASPGSYAMLENKLAWAPGSIDTILAGGEPKEVVSTLHKSTPNPPAPGLRAALDQPQRRLPGAHRGVVAGATPAHRRPPQ